MKRVVAVTAVALLACVSTPRCDAGTANQPDANVGDASWTDGGDEVAILDFNPPPGWADGGPVEWTISEFAELCGPYVATLEPQINREGSVLVGCGGSAFAGADDYVVLRSGTRIRTSSGGATFELLDDGTYWHQGESVLEDPFIYRRRFDGGVLERLPYQKALSATQTGWLSLQHWGTSPGDPYEVRGPDGGTWVRDGNLGPVLHFNESGIGVGVTYGRNALFVWKDGRWEESDFGADSCSARQINEHNLIAGERANPEYRAALFWGREYAEASVPVGNRSLFMAVNNLAVAVGTAKQSNFPNRPIGWGIAWARGQTVVLDDLARDAGIECLILSATDINDLNEVVGLATCRDAGPSDFTYYRMRLELTP